MPRSWRFLPFDRGNVRHLAGELKVSPILAQVLSARGYLTSEDATGFLTSKLNELHDPELLPGMTAAADRVVAAIKAQRRITVYGDYDVDGITSTSILWHCLKLAGAKVDYYLPHRAEGYGLNCDALRKLAEEDAGRMVITVDCGIASLREAVYARELGLELIVTDHHTFGEELPQADAVVHPRLPGGSYPFGELCGAGVAFKLAWAICTRLGEGKRASPPMREFLLSAVSLAAIGTVADVVPLVDENRVFVRFGLESLAKRAPLGLRALLKVSGLADKPGLVAEDIGYSLGPRLNAAGRLGQARLAVELLTTTNEQRATDLATYLEELNKERQSVERRIFKSAKEVVEAHPEWLEDAALVVASADWHGGVIGIVANRVAEEFSKPTILLSINEAQQVAGGSARSFAGFDLHAGLTACSEHLISYGGHQAAAGLKLEVGKIDAFREAFCAYTREHHVVTEADLELQIDAEIRLADLTVSAVNELDRLGPFGCQNARPLFASHGVELAEPPRKMGEGERHLSMKVRHYGKMLRVIAFGRGAWADEIAAEAGPISLCFAPQINRYQGRESVELQLVDWKPAREFAEVAAGEV